MPARAPPRKVPPVVWPRPRPKFGSRQEARPSTGRTSLYSVQHALTGGSRHLTEGGPAPPYQDQEHSRAGTASARQTVTQSQSLNQASQSPPRTMGLDDLMKTAERDESPNAGTVSMQPGATAHLQYTTRASEPRANHEHPAAREAPRATVM